MFKGINKTLILDDKLVTGSLQEQYEGALNFIKSKLELRYIIETAGQRVEISNQGGLVSSIKEKEFGKRSVSRNPFIFGLFQRLDLVEQVGSGITRMHDYMKAENLSAPEFSLKGIFVVTLYRPTNFNKWINNRTNDLTKNQIVILQEIYVFSLKSGLTATLTNSWVCNLLN